MSQCHGCNAMLCYNPRQINTSSSHDVNAAVDIYMNALSYKVTQNVAV